MAVALRSVSTAAFTALTSSGTLSINKPTGLTVGDVLVAHLSMVITSGANGNWDTPSGWTASLNTNESGNGNSEARLTVFYKVADASDVAASSFTFQADGTQPSYAGGALYAVSGGAISGTTVVDYTANATSATSTTTPSGAGGVTPPANSLLLFLTTSASANVTTGSVDSQAITTSNPTWAEQYDFVGSEGVANGTNRQGLMSGATALRPEATATGNTSATMTNFSQNHVLGLVAIPPVVDASATLTPLTLTVSLTTPAQTLSHTLTPLTLSVTLNAIIATTPAAKWLNTDKNAASLSNPHEKRTFGSYNFNEIGHLTAEVTANLTFDTPFTPSTNVDKNTVSATNVIKTP
jgi:hypothetical protein